MPPAEHPAAAGSTRQTPRALLAIAAITLIAAIATGIYEATQGRVAPESGPVIEVNR
jgi:hypothetical protein